MALTLTTSAFCKTRFDRYPLNVQDATAYGNTFVSTKGISANTPLPLRIAADMFLTSVVAGRSSVAAGPDRKRDVGSWKLRILGPTALGGF
jgi:hypothetical protein